LCFIAYPALLGSRIASQPRISNAGAHAMYISTDFICNLSAVFIRNALRINRIYKPMDIEALPYRAVG
ncbi:MAG: hypothetical protein J6W84_04485, partial [Bacteroidales bacterium]|nr:hypothetical protein [Bacteroidales bacterium]